MIFAIGTALAFAYLDMPWRIVALVPLAAIESLDIILWLRWRKRRSITGIEALVGMAGRALTDIDPEGQIRVKGQIWQAHATEPLEAGELVVVEEVEGLRMLVSRREPAGPGKLLAPADPDGIVR